MNAKSIVKIVLYGIAIVAPGGLVGVAGYRFVKYIRNRKKDVEGEDAVQDQDGK